MKSCHPFSSFLSLYLKFGALHVSLSVVGKLCIHEAYMQLSTLSRSLGFIHFHSDFSSASLSLSSLLLFLPHARSMNSIFFLLSISLSLNARSSWLSWNCRRASSISRTVSVDAFSSRSRRRICAARASAES